MTADNEPRPYDDAEVDATLAGDGPQRWRRDGDALVREYATDGWPTTLMLVNAVGYLCEAAFHHADLSVSWGTLGVRLTTHSSGGVTDKDFALARRIEDVVLWRPAADSPLDGTPNDFVSGGGAP